MTPIGQDELTRRVAALPSLPSIVTELARAVEREDVNLAVVADGISRDQGLAARTLRLANSSFYGLSNKVVSIQDAVAILGLRSLRTLVTAVAMRSRLPHTAVEGFDYVAFWRHSIGVALCARALATRCGVNPDNAFTAGLLHDIGCAVLASAFPDRYAETLALQRRLDCPLAEAERATLGLDHCAAGVALAKHWNFAPPLIDAVSVHHAPGERQPTSLAALTHVADVIASALDLAQLEHTRVPPLDADAWDGQRFDEASFHEVCSATLAPFQQLCEDLGV